MTKQILTVSELTAEIKAVLEEGFPFIWVVGEISNFRKPASGHFYFTLKDDEAQGSAQINAVMFRGQNRSLGFLPEDGMMVTGLGRISVYEPRGSYQLIFEYLEPKGVGQLQIAFEKLRARLEAEGLFEESRKRPIPFLPKKIGVVTSPTGAVIHDIMKVVNRRFPDMRIEIAPVRVQGEGAEREIAEAIRLLNRRGEADVMILGRGGGSLEDLQAFNAEVVARAIFESEIPVISAVGHETDFTIADFVADVRAPTPSAAAEMAVPVKSDLAAQLAGLRQSLINRMYGLVEAKRTALAEMSRRLVHPSRRIQDFRLRLDDLTQRLGQSCLRRVRGERERLAWRVAAVRRSGTLKAVSRQRERVGVLRERLASGIRAVLERAASRQRETHARLRLLGPEAVLSRGYAITRTVPDGAIVRDAAKVAGGALLDIKLAKGGLRCRVEERFTDAGEKADL